MVVSYFYSHRVEEAEMGRTCSIYYDGMMRSGRMLHVWTLARDLSKHLSKRKMFGTKVVECMKVTACPGSLTAFRGKQETKCPISWIQRRVIR
jgi:hypothetical protein